MSTKIQWAIARDDQLYYGTWRTRKDAIRAYLTDLGHWNWQECRADGDRAVKVSVEIYRPATPRVSNTEGLSVSEAFALRKSSKTLGASP